MKENEAKEMKPTLRLFIFGVVIIIFLWGIFMLGANVACKNAGGHMVNGLSFIKVSCFDVDVKEACFNGDDILIYNDLFNMTEK